MGRDTVDRYLALDIRKLNRLNLALGKLNLIQLDRGNQKFGSIMVEPLENENLLLQFNVQGWQEELTNPIRQTVSISRTPGRLGERRWFLCPFCHRRSAILYSFPYFMCRICVGLPYASRNQSAATRRLNRVVHQRLKMGGTESLWDPFPPRPKGMRQTNYERLKEEDARVTKPYLNALTDAADRMMASSSSKPSRVRRNDTRG
jgi:hypothetical protein